MMLEGGEVAIIHALVPNDTQNTDIIDTVTYLYFTCTSLDLIPAIWSMSDWNHISYLNYQMYRSY